MNKLFKKLLDCGLPAAIPNVGFSILNHLYRDFFNFNFEVFFSFFLFFILLDGTELLYEKKLIRSSKKTVIIWMLFTLTLLLSMRFFLQTSEPQGAKRNMNYKPSHIMICCLLPGSFFLLILPAILMIYDYRYL